MTSTSNVPAIFPAMAACLRDFGLVGIEKGETNSFQKFNYRSIGALLATANMVFAKNTIFMQQNVLNPVCEIRGQDSKGTNVYFVSFDFNVTFYSGIDGSSLPAYNLFVSAEGKDPSKLSGILTSYALKELLFKAFSIPTETLEDLDGRDSEGTPLTVRADLKVETNKAGIVWTTAPKALPAALTWGSSMTGLSATEIKAMIETIEPNATGHKMPAYVDKIKEIWSAN